MAKPRFNVTLKSKTAKEFRSVVAIWQNERGLSFTLDRDVAEIRYRDGTVITPADLGKDGKFYANVYENAGEGPPQRQNRQPGDDDSEMPF